MDDHNTLISLTHVCTHWRRVITTCPTVWTHVAFGGEGMPDSLVKLFFERAGRCALDVYISAPVRRPGRPAREQTIPTPSAGQRIATLSINHPWAQIFNILNGWAGTFSSLRMLDIVADEPLPSSRPPAFFGDTLKELKILGLAVPGLDYIRAPNLTVLNLYKQYQTPCSASKLLDFLEAAPALVEVLIYVDSTVVIDFLSPHRTITLPHAQFISLSIGRSPQLAPHIICPSSRIASFGDAFPDSLTADIFPPNLFELLGQWSVGIIDRVMMRVLDQDVYKVCSLKFYSPSGAWFQVACEPEHIPDLPLEDPVLEWTFSILFNQAVSALSSLPLNNVTSFSIDTESSLPDPTADSTEIARRLAELFAKCLKLHTVVLENHLPACLSALSQDRTPPIQVLVIKHPEDVLWEEFIERITEVAHVRCSRDIPLQRIEIVTASEENPRIEQLETWVQEVRIVRKPPS